MAACFVFRREINRAAFSDFCNTISWKADTPMIVRRGRSVPIPASRAAAKTLRRHLHREIGRLLALENPAGANVDLTH